MGERGEGGGGREVRVLHDPVPRPAMLRPPVASSTDVVNIRSRHGNARRRVKRAGHVTSASHAVLSVVALGRLVKLPWAWW